MFSSIKRIISNQNQYAGVSVTLKKYEYVSDDSSNKEAE